MIRRSKSPHATAALLALVVAAGCGGDDGPSSDEQFAQQVDERTRAVASRFERTFSDLARVSADGEIPVAATRSIRELADLQRAAADEIEALDPPADAEEPTAELVGALREHAGRLETAAQRQDLTFDRLTAATSPPPGLTRAIADLRRQGIEVARPLPGG